MFEQSLADQEKLTEELIQRIRKQTEVEFKAITDQVPVFAQSLEEMCKPWCKKMMGS